MTGIDIDAFERQALLDLNMPEEIPMRHRSPHFAHIFSGEGYSAGYYGYMWADVLTSDAAEAFAEAPGGFYDKEVAAKLVEHLFAPRNSLDPAEAYKAFRGREPRMEALMRDCRFICAIRMHTQGMTLEEATNFFMDNAFMEELPARKEASRGTFDPMYLNYTLGKLMILKLREDFRDERGDGFSLKEFHDTFLSFGAPPIPLVRCPRSSSWTTHSWRSCRPAKRRRGAHLIQCT